MGFIRKKPKIPGISKQKAFMFFTTLADVGSLFMALIYVAYVALLMLLGIGVGWLNWSMFGITIAYIGFFVFKLTYLNKTMKKTGRIKRMVKLANKYTKFGMRIINAAFVVLSLIGVQFGLNQGVALIGILIVGVTFIVSILWDIGNFVMRKKIQEITLAWNDLSQEEKSERIELFVSGFIRSINNTANFDDYVDVGLNIKKMVDNKLGDRIRLADARKKPKDEDGSNGDDEVEKE